MTDYNGRNGNGYQPLPLAHQQGEISYRQVIIETPFAGNVARNKAYLEACMRDCILNHKDAPFASHKLYTDCLDDNNPTEREIGIKAGLTWGLSAEACVVYYDFGLSKGMIQGVENAERNGIPVERRKLPKCLMDELKWNYEGTNELLRKTDAVLP